MNTRTELVKARMTEAETRALSRLAQQQRVPVSEILRRLVGDEIERARRRKVVGGYLYLAEKLGEGLQQLTLTDDPAAIARAFGTIARGLGQQQALPDDTSVATPRQWAAQIATLIDPSPDDRAHVDADRLGAYHVRAQRMTQDEKNDLRQALWSLYSFITLELRAFG